MSNRVQFYYAGSMIVLALILGGGTAQGLWTDRILEVALIPALIIGFGGISESRWSSAAKALAVAVLVLFAVQFLPLGRQWPSGAPVAEGTFLTVAADRTFESLLFFASALGFSLFVSRFPDQEQERLLRFVIVGLLINLGVGALQLSASNSGVGSAELLPYDLRAGVFANPNHFSTLVFSVIPVLAYFFLYRQKRPALFALVLAPMLIYQFAVGSEAGMGLSIAIAAISLLLFSDKLSKRLVMFATALAGIVALVVSVQFLGLGVDEVRAMIWRTTSGAIADHWLVGTGIGSFVNVYPFYEDPAQITSEYINHAHNDYLEIILETGIFGILLVLFFVVVASSGAGRTTLAKSFFVATLAILIHSLVDYPLRTMAISILLGYFASHLLAADGRPPQSGRTRTTSRSSRNAHPADNIPTV